MLKSRIIILIIYAIKFGIIQLIVQLIIINLRNLEQDYYKFFDIANELSMLKFIILWHIPEIKFAAEDAAWHANVCEKTKIFNS